MFSLLLIKWPSERVYFHQNLKVNQENVELCLNNLSHFGNSFRYVCVIATVALFFCSIILFLLAIWSTQEFQEDSMNHFMIKLLSLNFYVENLGVVCGTVGEITTDFLKNTYSQLYIKHN